VELTTYRKRSQKPRTFSKVGIEMKIDNSNPQGGIIVKNGFQKTDSKFLTGDRLFAIDG